MAQNICDDLIEEKEIHTHAIVINGCKQTEGGLCKNGFDSFVPNQVDCEIISMSTINIQ
jgi:hypothetical protein